MLPSFYYYHHLKFTVPYCFLKCHLPAYIYQNHDFNDFKRKYFETKTPRYFSFFTDVSMTSVQVNLNACIVQLYHKTKSQPYELRIVSGPRKNIFYCLFMSSSYHKEKSFESCDKVQQMKILLVIDKKLLQGMGVSHHLKENFLKFCSF